MHLTVSLRLRDKFAKRLKLQSDLVNIVWNYCNEVQQKGFRDRRKGFSYGDLARLTAGTCKVMDLHSSTVQSTCRSYCDARFRNKKPWLRFRGKKSLGWVPFGATHVLFDGEAFVFRGVRYEPMHLRGYLKPGMRFPAGSFNADRKGRWYINVPVEIDAAAPRPENAVGIDLGLKTLATLSTGDKIEMPRFLRASEAIIGMAQRARKTRRARTIHARVRNRRKDFQHKASKALCEEYGTIIVGDVSPSKTAKTRMAKSVNDAGWAGFKKMLSYKAMRHGGRFIEVSEAMTTQTCSACGSVPPSRPKGIAGLRIREWTCDDCSTVHDRDHNGAQNILRIGLDTLVAGAH